jgi:Rps23 Pro-64 3,4-dihydroxylase Tpa1-like proline 4-hydroxylase
MHFDSDALLDGRRVTAIIYLNDNWHLDGAYGGQLRLYPFPAPPLDIAPLADRMVLFASTSMLHRFVRMYAVSTALSACGQYEGIAQTPVTQLMCFRTSQS